MERKVYQNCIAFLKVSPKPNQEKPKELLDSTRIHPHDYHLAKRIAKDCLDEEVLELDMEASLEKVMKHTEKLSDLDLEDHAEHLAKIKNKHNMLCVLTFIVQELQNPFLDPRVRQPEMGYEQVFYKLCRDTAIDFHVNSFVQCKIIRVMKSNLQVKVVQNGVLGSIYVSDAFDKSLNLDLTQHFVEGQILTAKVKAINFERAKIELTIKPSEMKITKENLKGFVKDWERYESTFKLSELDDIPSLMDHANQTRQLKYVPRQIAHPKFKNMSL